jgi:hypothetical protein
MYNRGKGGATSLVVFSWKGLCHESFCNKFMRVYYFMWLFCIKNNYTHILKTLGVCRTLNCKRISIGYSANGIEQEEKKDSRFRPILDQVVKTSAAAVSSIPEEPCIRIQWRLNSCARHFGTLNRPLCCRGCAIFFIDCHLSSVT